MADVIYFTFYGTFQKMKPNETNTEMQNAQKFLKLFTQNTDNKQ